ncbi:eukaryotic translation elongation factor 1 epsilon-1 [Caerostris darwini]|uniref:Eukaryotic translation elongation factor 1 epsilon-1 n=2 Tax=Caerostris darwini TaxID=1538125 RepID=A0AAV4PWU0_9ARAC|nr:eukaryotic translation elongation factor 1 epsilon-1 [Caerostris darwini]
MDLTKLLINAGRILNVNNQYFVANPNSQSVNLITHDGQELKCFVPAALYIGQVSSKNGFIGSTKEEQASVYQWLEYCLLKSQSQSHEILKELNIYLQDKVYFVGNKFTIVDLIMYLSLYEIFSRLSFQDKEVYFNVSRWFRQVQNEACAEEMYPKICFAKTKIYT